MNRVVNRTMKDKVRRACRYDKIFRDIWINDDGKSRTPSWVLTRKQCAEVDAKLRHVVCCPSEYVPKEIMKKRGGSKGHDTHIFGSKFAAWALWEHIDKSEVKTHIQLWSIFGALRSHVIDPFFIPE